MKICYDNLEKIYFTSKKTWRSLDRKIGYTYKDSCDECGEPYFAVASGQRFCDVICKGNFIEKQTLQNRACKKCGEKDPEKFYKLSDSKCKKCTLFESKIWRQNNPEIVRRSERKKWKNIRKKAIEFYGNKCECCGESRYEFLALDHINGGGNRHKKQLKEEGISIWYWLQRNNYPSGFRVLCHNCNQSMGAWGYCPHQKEKDG